MESSQASQSRVYTDLDDGSAGGLEALLEAALECQPGHVLVKAVVFVTVAAALINLPVGSAVRNGGGSCQQQSLIDW